MRSKHTCADARRLQGHEHADCADGRAPCLGARVASGHYLTSSTSGRAASKRAGQAAHQECVRYSQCRDCARRRVAQPTSGREASCSGSLRTPARSITSIYPSETSRLGVRAGHERHVPISIRPSPPRRCRTPFFPSRLVSRSRLFPPFPFQPREPRGEFGLHHCDCARTGVSLLEEIP